MFSRPFRKIFLPLSLTAAAAFPQETLSSVQRELDRVERETAREKELHKAERARAAEFEKRKAEKLQALREQIRLEETAGDSLKREMEAQRRRKAAQKGQAAFYQSKSKEFRSALAGEMDEVLAWVERDFPYQKEKRLSEWRGLAKANREAALPVEETLARAFALTQVSLDFARDTEAYPGSYAAADGSQWEGVYVRLGAVLLAFSSSDGKMLAYLAKTDSSYVWRDRDLTPEAREGILAAVQVSLGKAAPRLVPMPLEAPAAKEVGR